jgi:hypothetical protein
MEVYLYAILNLNTGRRLVVNKHHGHCTPGGKWPATHCVGGRDSPTIGLDALDKRKIYFP